MPWVNFGPKCFEFVQHDRALLVNKGANGEDCEKKTLFGLQMRHFYPKLGQRLLIHLVLRIHIRDFSRIVHDGRGI